MWVFGYGSLAWDNWAARFDCLHRVVAELPEFRRTFNKASVKNWGNTDNPCPTLNLAADPSRTCIGVAFEFPEEKQKEVIDYLKNREGKGYRLAKAELRLKSGDRISAIVPIYSGPNLLSGGSLAVRAEMARTAQGDSGTCIDYVRNIAMELAHLGIDDPEVAEFWRALK